MQSPRTSSARRYPPKPPKGKTERGAGAIVSQAKEFLQKGEPLRAFDLLDSGLRQYLGARKPRPASNPLHRRMWQLKAVALARAGASVQARAILEPLSKKGAVDAETLGILGRTYKDERRFQEAFKHYHQGFRLARSLYPQKHDDAIYAGINAAGMALLLGRKAESHRLARLTLEHCRARLAGGGNYWAEATQAEAELLLGNIEAARALYGQAALGTKDPGDIASSRKQAHLLLPRLGYREDALDSCFGLGPVVMFAGHMIDRPHRKPARFPPRIEPEIAQAIADRLKAINPSYGFASAACGADILFLEAMQKLEKPTHVVLPFPQEKFAETSVAFAGGKWVRRFRRVVKKSDGRLDEVSPYAVQFGSASYGYANQILHGLASLKGQELGVRAVGMAVWDRETGDGPGGTGDAIRQWQRAGIKVEIIDPHEFLGRRRTKSLPRPAQRPSQAKTVAVLFADVVKFSNLDEEQMVPFRNRFLKVIGELTKKQIPRPILVNTWGDALFLVFDSKHLAGAARFALNLQSRITNTPWGQFGLPPELSLRVGLHAGPALECANPITGRRDYLGFHVSRGARIEPSTPDGQVYASRAFAALAQAHGAGHLQFDYVGQVALPKDAGVIALYHVHNAPDFAPGTGEE